MPPLISSLLPTWNPGRFLEERLHSIFQQTVSDWELVIVDSQSTDGSLSLLKKLAETDPRVSFFERPRGLYQAWNFAIQQAKGKYIYIATADDTMTDDALQKMSEALEEHPECDLCDTRLKLIDAESRELNDFEDGYVAHCWHLAYPRERKHIRKRYADFFAHFGGKTVYLSATQLLIRKTLFEKTGGFPEDFGPSADYMWGIRAAFYADVIYLPEKLATWRIHQAQATSGNMDVINKNYSLMYQMAQVILQEGIPEEIAAKARKIARLAAFKGILLPAKVHKHSLYKKLPLLFRAFWNMPFLTLEFVFTLSYYWCYIPRSFVFIYTYDKMIYRHTKHFYCDKVLDCK